MNPRTEELKKFLREEGVTLAGIGDITSPEAREAISKEFHHYTRLVAIGMKLHKYANPEDEGKSRDEHAHWLSYMEENHDITLKLKVVIEKTAKLLKSWKAKCLPIPPISLADDHRFIATLYPLFSHRMAVTMAGLGWIGKNGMALNGEYGPNLVWATILTDADVTPSPPQLESQCGECRLCAEACPVGAITGISWSRAKGKEKIIDVESCAAYMEQNSGKYGRPVCGICFMACPVGVKKTRRSG